MQRILVISESMNNGGVQKSLLPLLRQLSENKEIDTSLILIKKEGSLLSDIPKNVSIINTPDSLLIGSLNKNQITRTISLVLKKYNFKLMQKYIYYIIKGLIKKNMGVSRQEFWKIVKNSVNDYTLPEFDIILVFQHGVGSYYAIDKVQAKEKYVWVHSDYNVFNLNKEIDGNYFKKFNKIIAVSKTCKEILSKVFPNLSNEILEINNLLPIEEIKRAAIEDVEEFTKDERKVNLVSVSRIDKNKGFDLAFPAVKKLIEEEMVNKWYIVGDGDYKKKLKKIAKKEGISDYVIFVGMISNPYPYIKKTDIFLHASRFEGKSVAVEEAKLLKTPILVTNYSTVTDQIIHDYSGYICEMTSDGIYNGLKYMILNKEIREKFARNLEDELKIKTPNILHLIRGSKGFIYERE